MLIFLTKEKQLELLFLFILLNFGIIKLIQNGFVVKLCFF